MSLNYSQRQKYGHSEEQQEQRKPGNYQERNKVQIFLGIIGEPDKGVRKQFLP